MTAKNNDLRNMANFLSCLSVLEREVARFYNGLSAKIKNPMAKSLLFSIAQDSTKHSGLFRGVADSLMPTNVGGKNCEKVGEPWRLLASLNKEIEKKKSYSDQDFTQLSEMLAYLESIIGEEYYVFIQLKTLERMVKEINQIYRIDLGSLKSIFTHIINDEERHREIIEQIRVTLEKKKVDDEPKTLDPPLVKYTNPDNWISPFSQANQQ